MKRGVVIFAHNNGITDYYKMAAYTASRINRFLDLPVTVITDPDSVSDTGYTFDNTIYLEPDTTNQRNRKSWLNKGRYRVYDYTPYDDTLVLDTDYMVNSGQLLRAFDYDGDFLCHNTYNMLMISNKAGQLEYMHRVTAPTLWATVLRFTKTQRSQQIFQMIQMVQENYEHYTNLYGFASTMYRNDYALTMALRAVNGQMTCPEDYLRWDLLHVDPSTKVVREDETVYRVYKQNQQKRYGEESTYSWMRVRDLDFHMLSKTKFEELML
jgi:hypothetical protein